MQLYTPFTACSNYDPSSLRLNTAQNPHFPDVLRLHAVAGNSFQMMPEKAAVLHCTADGVKGSVLFISWTDLLRKGIPLGAKGTLTDGWGR